MWPLSLYPAWDLAQLYGTVRNATDMAEHYDVPKHRLRLDSTWQTSGMWLSIALAVVIELPLAFLLLNAARRLIRLSALVAVSEREWRRAPAVLWRIPLVGENAGEKAGERE